MEVPPGSAIVTRITLSPTAWRGEIVELFRHALSSNPGHSDDQASRCAGVFALALLALKYASAGRMFDKGLAVDHVDAGLDPDAR